MGAAATCIAYMSFKVRKVPQNAPPHAPPATVNVFSPSHVQPYPATVAAQPASMQPMTYPVPSSYYNAGTGAGAVPWGNAQFGPPPVAQTTVFPVQYIQPTYVETGPTAPPPDWQYAAPAAAAAPVQYQQEQQQQQSAENAKQQWSNV